MNARSRSWWLSSVLCVAVWATGCGAADDGDDRATRCTKVRDHLISLRVANVRSESREAHRTAFEKALGGEFMARCQRAVDDRDADCILAARDVQAAAACHTN